MASLAGLGVVIVDRVAVAADHAAHRLAPKASAYLATKARRMGHLLPVADAAEAAADAARGALEAGESEAHEAERQRRGDGGGRSQHRFPSKPHEEAAAALLGNGAAGRSRL